MFSVSQLASHYSPGSLSYFSKGAIALDCIIVAALVNLVCLNAFGGLEKMHVDWKLSSTTAYSLVGVAGGIAVLDFVFTVLHHLKSMQNTIADRKKELFSSQNLENGADKERVYEFHSKFSTMIDQKPNPKAEQVNAAQRIPCHNIRGDLFLGSEDALFDAIYNNNPNKLTTIITVCPLGELKGKRTKDKLEQEITKQGIEWHYVGDGVNDNADCWQRLATNCGSGQGNEFELIFKQLDEAIASKKRILVHCKKGMSKSAFLLGVYFINRYGLSPLEAMLFINNCRPSAFAVANNFCAGLIAYAEKLSKANSKR